MNPAFNISARRVGGITFIRFGRLSFTFCITSRAKLARAFPRAFPILARIDPSDLAYYLAVWPQ